MKDITVIIPFHEGTDENYALLERAIGSVKEGYAIYISTPSTLEMKDVKLPNEDSKILKETDKSTFQDLVNEAVKKVETKKEQTPGKKPEPKSGEIVIELPDSALNDAFMALL